VILTPGQLATRADFYFQLAGLVTAGIPLIQALEMVRANARSLRAPLSVTLARLQAGATFGEALNATGQWLPPFDRAVIAAGEISGRLDATLKMLGNHYQERSVLLRRIMSDMAYPFFILHLAVFIFPTGLLGKLFWSGGVQAFVVQKTLVLAPLYAIIFFGILALQGNRGERWRAFMERVLNAVPLLGSARKNLALAQFSAGLEALLSAGVPVIQSWEIASRASGSNGIKRAVTWAVPKLEAGMVPSEALRQLPVFPELFQNLYASGEISGQLDTTLNRLHRHYQELATLKFQNIGQWTPKIVFLIVAIAIGYQVITFYTDYFGQIEKMGL
jgi:type II secretory pathway component PulF